MKISNITVNGNFLYFLHHFRLMLIYNIFSSYIHLNLYHISIFSHSQKIFKKYFENCKNSNTFSIIFSVRITVKSWKSIKHKKKNVCISTIFALLQISTIYLEICWISLNFVEFPIFQFEKVNTSEFCGSVFFTIWIVLWFAQKNNKKLEKFVNFVQFNF